ncbi:MAG: hypothetical protein LH609_05060, partial [Rudanella sp.]|nr:hypothetical protein [Rudanella sp.]
INADRIPDVFIGGRSAQLLAVNGKTGKIIWEFFPQPNPPGKTVSPADSGWFNFFNPQFVPDQDGDGLEELLVSNGGNYLIQAHDPNRPVGNLLVVSSLNGSMLAKAPMPDGKETYLSPVVADFGGGELWVIFGTGGETIGGGLYKVRLADVLRGDVSRAELLASSATKGFIAPPVLVDITADGVYDIITNSVDGRMLAIDGATDSLLWQVEVPHTEAYSAPTVGYFNEDSIPDFFANYGVGVWPAIIRSVQLLVDGKTGNVLYRNSLGGFQYASPVTADMNGDGFDDGLLSINTRYADGNYEDVLCSRLMVFDFHNRAHYPVGDTLLGHNLASTPWAGDLNGDGKLEIIACSIGVKQLTNDIDNPRALRISLFATSQPAQKTIAWGAYMGSGYDGLFRKKNTRSSKKKPGF